MTLRLSNDVIIIRGLPQNFFVKNCNYLGVTKKTPVKFCNFHSNILRGSVVA